MRRGALLVLMLACVALTACGSSSKSGKSSTSTSLGAFTVSSSITDGQTLDKAVSWMATPKGAQNVTSVDFLIDDEVKWSERNAPYYFDDDHGVLPPWLLGAGDHQLAVRATAKDGRTATTTAAVKVPATPPNTALAGTYERMVTDADSERVAPYRTNRFGAFGNLPPNGRWTLKISADGLVRIVDPDGGTSYEPYTAKNQTMTLYGPAVWLQANPNDPFLFCDPEGRSDYKWSANAASLDIASLDKVCADRDNVFEGHWTRRA